MKKQGAIILGIGEARSTRVASALALCAPRAHPTPRPRRRAQLGGDNSDSAIGTFFEGCITVGYTTDATDDAVQANIVAARYGSAQ